MEKVILTSGGTGGHIFPALAVAEELRNKYPDIQLLFVGSLYGPEKELTRKWDIPFIGLDVRGFLGRGLKAVPAFIKMLRAIYRSNKIMKDFTPDCLAGFGGYASFAPALAAFLNKIPFLIQEQNAVAGTGNRVLARFADRVCVTMPDTRGVGLNPYISGNPVRKIFNSVHSNRLKRKPERNLLVLGGSQGAQALNNFVRENITFFNDNNISVWLQTGKKDFERIRENFPAGNSEQFRISPFIEHMEEAYEWADLVLCRSGASTIAELSICGLPAMFVPFPFAIHDHQTRNARTLADAGAAILLPESELNSPDSRDIILRLISDTEKLGQMGNASYRLARKNAAELIVNCMEDILSKKKDSRPHE